MHPTTLKRRLQHGKAMLRSSSRRSPWATLCLLGSVLCPGAALAPPSNKRRAIVQRSNNLVAYFAAATIGSAPFLPSLLIAPPALAFQPDEDSSTDTVAAAIQSVRDSGNNVQALVKAYENIAEIITEGKGVGGAINYQGIRLDRGYIANEDTTLYNPGLTLLTESEKTRLVDAIVESRRLVGADRWDVDAAAGFDFLREKLDPYHMYELAGYLSILPFYGAAVYLAVLVVQQVARDLFPVAYIAGAVAIFAPVVALVLIGPQ
jgi:hypothetical protein